MSIPDTIYMHPASQVDVYTTTDGEGRIAYDRRRTCAWTTEDDDFGVWDTGCANAFEFSYDGPKENFFKWCPYCGGHIKLDT